MSIAAAIEKIRQAGFTIEAEGDHIAIEPFDELTAQQIEWLRGCKLDILAALRSSETLLDTEGGHDLTPANDQASIIVECWTPSGIRRLVRADSPEHADWIRAANPPPKAVMTVRCADCQQATITNGISACTTGVGSGLPIGGFWATDVHDCDSFMP